MASKPPELPRLHYFCDESSQVKDTWLAVGGIAVMQTAIPKIVSDLQLIKAKVGKTGEVKWANAKSFGGVVHRGYIDYLFLLLESRKAHFHIRFSDMNEYDHGLSGPRKKVDTVSKSFYQLMLHRPVKYYHGKTNVHLYPDDGCCTEQLPDQLPKLKNDAWTKFGPEGHSCPQEITPRASKSEPMLQLLDVTLGALAALKNERHLIDGYSPVKRDLAEYALKKTGWLRIGGSNYDKRCNRWTVKPNLKRGQKR